jgi:hypothetical protein
MPPAFIFRKLVVSVALCVLPGAAAKAETVSGPKTDDNRAIALNRTSPSETTGMLLLGTGLVGVATVLRRKLNADKPE